MACTGGRSSSSRSIHAVLGLLLPALMLMIICSCSTSTSANASAIVDFCWPWEQPDKPVYPYWSMCTSPATYQEQFQLRSTNAVFGGEGGLAPEWDESNSTYYIRLAEEAATYRLSYRTREFRRFVSQYDDVYFYNVETGRPLAWRQEGDEYFLVEADPLGGGSALQFLQVPPPVNLPCPLILGARCETYALVSYLTSEGLSAYPENDVVYFKKASSDLASFVLLRVSATSGLKAATRTSLATST